MASVLIIKPCPFCKNEYQKMFPADGYRRYQAGEKVQNCFPHMSTDDREFLITGTCPTCWGLTFGGED